MYMSEYFANIPQDCLKTGKEYPCAQSATSINSLREFNLFSILVEEFEFGDTYGGIL